MKYIYAIVTDEYPEQYDVFNGETGEKIAYVRLRFGLLSVEVPDAGGEEIYYHYFRNDFKGQFKSKCERMRYLRKIDRALRRYEKRKAKIK